MTLIQKPNPGDVCRVCKTGKLQARTRAQSSTNREVIGGPVFPSYQHLTEVVCGACGVKFEPQHVGQSINEPLEDQLISFQNPETKPEQCPNCDSKNFVRGRMKTQLDAFPVSSDFASRRAREEDDSHHHYIYCKHCLKIVWDEPLVERPKHSTEALARFAESVGARPFSSRGPATPIPQGKKPVRRTPGERPPNSKR